MGGTSGLHRQWEGLPAVGGDFWGAWYPIVGWAFRGAGLAVVGGAFWRRGFMQWAWMGYGDLHQSKGAGLKGHGCKPKGRG